MCAKNRHEPVFGFKFTSVFSLKKMEPLSSGHLALADKFSRNCRCPAIDRFDCTNIAFVAYSVYLHFIFYTKAITKLLNEVYILLMRNYKTFY